MLSNVLLPMVCYRLLRLFRGEDGSSSLENANAPRLRYIADAGGICWRNSLSEDACACPLEFGAMPVIYFEVAARARRLLYRALLTRSDAMRPRRRRLSFTRTFHVEAMIMHTRRAPFRQLMPILFSVILAIAGCVDTHDVSQTLHATIVFLRHCRRQRYYFRLANSERRAVSR